MPPTEHLSIRKPAFFQRLEGIPQKQILGVAIDIAKEFHRVLLFDFNAQVLRPPFSIDVLQSGYTRLTDEIRDVRGAIDAQQILIGVEAMGFYGENLVRRLAIDGYPIFLINTAATASVRKQRSQVGLKTDDIDTTAIAELLMRGECRPFTAEEQVYEELRQRVYWRENKLRMKVYLKNQITHHLYRIFPGTTSTFGGNRPLFERTFGVLIPQGLMRLGHTPQQFLKEPSEALLGQFHRVDVGITRSQAEEVHRYLDRLLPLPENVSQVALQLLQRDVRVLDRLQWEMASVEVEMETLVHQTPGRHLLGQIKGISDLMVASYMGLIGDVNRYRNARKVFAKAGLQPSLHQSGSTTKRTPHVTKTGNRHLRTLLFKMATKAVQHEPTFKEYYQNMRQRQQKPWRVAVVAVANKLNRVLFALLRDQSAFRSPRNRQPLGTSNGILGQGARKNC